MGTGGGGGGKRRRKGREREREREREGGREKHEGFTLHPFWSHLGDSSSKTRLI